jgi:hypothetical protein
MTAEQPSKEPIVPEKVDPTDVKAMGDRLFTHLSQPEDVLGVSPEEPTTFKKALDARQAANNHPEEDRQTNE